jgi:general stress protein YciG
LPETIPRVIFGIDVTYAARYRLRHSDASQNEDAMDKPKSKRGFASMSPEKRREIASLGGKSIPAERRSFSRDPELAAAAGRKGGLARAAARRGE